MKNKILRVIVITAFTSMVSSSAFAHHGVAHYDMKKTITLNGTIAAFDWGNPHCLVHVDVPDENGRVQHWTLEMSSAFAMSRKGWDKDTLKKGDRVVAETHPAQNGLTLGISSGPGFSLKFMVNEKELLAR